MLCPSDASGNCLPAATAGTYWRWSTESPGHPQEFRVDLAGKLEPRRRQRRQRAEHLDIAVAEFHEIGGKLFLRVAHHSTLILASWMILRHFGSSDLTKLIRSSGEPAIDWNR